MMLIPLKVAAIALAISAAAPLSPLWAAALIDTQDTVPPAICVLDATTWAVEPAAVLPPVAACHTNTNGSTLSQQS